MTIGKRRLGYRNDTRKTPADKQDWRFEDVEPTLRVQRRVAGTLTKKASSSLRPWVLSVLDQGNIGSCVANSAAQAIRILHGRQGHQDLRLLARLWGYFIARAYTKTTKIDDGCQIRNIFRGFNEYGFIPESEYSHGYSTDLFDADPPLTAFRKAFDQKNKGDCVYRRIRNDKFTIAEDIRVALDAGFPVVFGAQLTAAFLDYDKGSKIWEPHPPHLSIGGHAMCLVAHGERAPNVFTAVGSWGPHAHDEGYHHFSESFVRELFQDVWVVEKAPDYSTT